MSEEELNQELSTDELKDVSGGLTDSEAQAKVRFRNKYEPKGDLLEKKKGNKSSWSESDMEFDG